MKIRWYKLHKQEIVIGIRVHTYNSGAYQPLFGWYADSAICIIEFLFWGIEIEFPVKS